MTAASLLESLRLEAPSQTVLLYAASCPRCRWMARVILWLSAGAITGLPLQESAWRRFYDEELPESYGSPVLVRNGKPHWGIGVFPLTLWLAMQGAASGWRRGA